MQSRRLSVVSRCVAGGDCDSVVNGIRMMSIDEDSW